MPDRMIRLRKHVHLATYGPAGSGKGVSVLVPNLLSYRGSCVCTDPKGELFELTADHRRRKFGHKIIRLDPFGVCGPGSDTLNPFDCIDAKADDFLDQSRELANMTIVRTGQEKEPHWNDSAELMLTAFIAFICGCEPDPAERNLATVRGLASSKTSYNRTLEVMQQVEACEGVIRRLGGQLTHFTGEELGSVLTTFGRQTALFDSPVVSRNVATSSFDPMILRQKRATVYLILPANRLVSHVALQRLWIGTIMSKITSGKATEKNPVLWLLDEFAHIGRMQAIEDAVTLKRGMGQRLWFFFQSTEQLKTTFGDKAATIQENIGTEQFLAVRLPETAEHISKRIGETTISIETESDSQSTSMPTGGGGQGGGGASRSNSSTRNRSDIARRLLKPEEILTLPKDVSLIFHENLPVIIAQQLRYYDAPEFAKRGLLRRYGTGRQGGLGLLAGALCLLTLAASLCFTQFVAKLPKTLVTAGRTNTPATRRRSSVTPVRPVFSPQPYRGFVPPPPAGFSPAYGNRTGRY